MPELLGNGWSIIRELHEYICRAVPVGATILELGSGDGTQALVGSGYRMVSIEHDENYVGKASGSKYFHAPLVCGWYAVDVVMDAIQEAGDYSLLLVDGPPGNDRLGFLKHIHLFNDSVPWVFDDVNRPKDLFVARSAAYRLEREMWLSEFYDHPLVDYKIRFAVLKGRQG